MHQQDRRHRDDADQGCVEHRSADFDRRIGNDAPCRRPRSSRIPLAKAREDILDIDDGIIDHRGNRRQQARNHHDVEVGAAQVEYRGGGNQRQGNGCCRHQCRPPTAEQSTQRDDREESSDQARSGQVAGRLLDKARGSIDGRVDVDPGHARPQFVKRSLYVLGNLHRVVPRGLLDHKQEARTILKDGVADKRLMTFDYIGNLAQLERRSDYRDAGEILGRRDGKDVTYIKSLVRRIDKPASAGRRRIQIGQRR